MVLLFDVCFLLLLILFINQKAMPILKMFLIAVCLSDHIPKSPYNCLAYQIHPYTMHHLLLISKQYFHPLRLPPDLLPE